jgi:hypothetical protein
VVDPCALAPHDPEALADVHQRHPLADAKRGGRLDG